MSFDFVEIKENENIIPNVLPEKEKYYLDLMNIEDSFIGRIDVLFSNDFFREATQLIINAITLYEKGYFDCAFYSLRQSLEISTTIIYFVDDEESNRDKKLKIWSNEKRFPQQGQMLNELKNRKRVFADLKIKMSSYFEEIEQTKRKLNKYVHKQGIDKFYTSRSHPLRKINKDRMPSDFEASLIKSIGAIAVFRLAIDPLPILLNDESIYRRTPQLMTECYSDNFIEKYIGKKHIEDYKETKLFKDHYESIIQNEEMSSAVTELVKNDFFDRNNINEIIKQKHLLGQNDLVALAIFSFSKKIAKIYCAGGWHFYFSDVRTTRKHTGWSSKDFEIFKNSTQKFNRDYEGAYLSCVGIWKEEYYLEHIEKLEEGEIKILKELSAFHTPNT